MAPISPHLSALTSLGIQKATAAYALKEFDDAETAADWCFSPEVRLFPISHSPLLYWTNNPL